MESLVTLAEDARDLWVPSVVPRRPASGVTAAEFLREHVIMNRPVVFTGALDDAASGHAADAGSAVGGVWTEAGIVAALGDKPVSVEVTPDGRGDAIKDGVFVEPWTAKMPVGDFFRLQRQRRHRHGHRTGADDATAGPADCGAGDRAPNAVHYLSHQNSNLTEEAPELLPFIRGIERKLSFAREAFGSSPDAVNLWIGPDDAVTSLHKDHYENMYAVLRGEKIFTLFPPTDLPFLYETTVRSGRYRPRGAGGEPETGAAAAGDGGFEVEMIPPGELGSTRPWLAVDPSKPVDLGAYPLYAHARPVTVTVRAGEVLYLPCLWFHQVGQRGDPDFAGCTLAVNWWYDMQFGPQYTYYKLMEDIARRERDAREAGAGAKPGHGGGNRV